MSLLDLLGRGLPGTLRVKRGSGFAVGEIPTASLPTCNATREGEERRSVGSGATPSHKYICEWDGAAYAWTQMTPISTATNLSVYDGGVLVDATVSKLTFDASDFTVTEPVEDEALITLAYGTSAGTPAEGNHTHSVSTGYTVGPYFLFVTVPDNTGANAQWEWTNQPLASTELFGNARNRKEADLTDLTQFLFAVETTVVGTAGSTLNLEYTTDLTGATGWTTMGATAVSTAAVAWTKTAWTDIPAGAKTYVLLRVIGAGGNSTADPRYNTISAQFRGVGVQGPTGATGAAGANALISSLTDTATVDLTNTAGALSADVINDSITYAKIQNVSAASKLVGRGDSGSGDPQEITLGGGLAMTGTTVDVVAASDTVAGKVELATTAETTTGTDATRAVTPDGLHDMTSLAGAAWFLDEDAMGSNSDTKVPSQQSVKAYADTKQPLDATLTSLAAYNTAGFIAQTAADTFAGRTIQGTATKISVTNGAGFAGDPAITIVDSVALVSPTVATSITMAAGANIILDAAGAGTKIGTATTQKLGFYNSTPIVKGTAFTQTFATASHTVPAATQLAAPAGGAGVAAGGWSSAANRDLAITSINAARTDIDALKQALNGLIDDLQALGLIA